MTTTWEYEIGSFPTENLADEGWIAHAHKGPGGLDHRGEEGWEAVFVIEREDGYVHVLFKRPQQDASATKQKPVLDQFMS